MATDSDLALVRSTHSIPLVFGAGAAIGVLGGMIGWVARSSVCPC